MPEALKWLNEAANAPLPVPLLVTHGARCLPPTGSTAGCALVWITCLAISPVPFPPTGSAAGFALALPTPPPGGSDS